jgi:hypothetical protein
MPKSPMRSGAPTLAQAVAEMQKARARGPGRRSPLYVWLRENHDGLMEAFAKSAPAWEALAAYLGEHGIRDGDAKPPTARGARDAWWRVRKDVVAARTRRQEQPALELEHSELAPGVSRIVDLSVDSPPRSADLAEDLGESPRTFRMATLRGHKPPPPSSVPAPLATDKSLPADIQDPDEVISRLVGRSAFKSEE